MINIRKTEKKENCICENCINSNKVIFEITFRAKKGCGTIIKLCDDCIEELKVKIENR